MIRPAMLVLLIGTSFLATAATRDAASDAPSTSSTSVPTPDEWKALRPDIHVAVHAVGNDLYEVRATISDLATGRSFAAFSPLVPAGAATRVDAGTDLPGSQVVSFEVTVAADGRTASAAVEIRRDGVVASRSASVIAVAH